MKRKSLPATFFVSQLLIINYSSHEVRLIPNSKFKIRNSLSRCPKPFEVLEFAFHHSFIDVAHPEAF
jgi:hypothetical protein